MCLHNIGSVPYCSQIMNYSENKVERFFKVTHIKESITKDCPVVLWSIGYVNTHSSAMERDKSATH